MDKELVPSQVDLSQIVKYWKLKPVLQCTLYLSSDDS